jgi:hypothetical protein
MYNKIVIKQLRSKSKIEREGRLYTASKVHENQCIGLTEECCKTSLCLPLAPSVEWKLNTGV